eukprot:TRINITY_DN9808_c0_g1_i1.p1 TRINITY_DN9808_c0_g1~~TRINITY_DN9808_c0_g1_i1.p1  ORF type:complete len:166 (+),score=31.19 TRINITY_DN9808_c0_g1_i1:51-548(+)
MKLVQTEWIFRCKPRVVKRLREELNVESNIDDDSFKEMIIDTDNITSKYLIKISEEDEALTFGTDVNTYRNCKKGLGFLSGIILTPIVITAGLGVIGFGSGGVIAGSLAASLQSSSTVAGGLFATAQSIGATGSLAYAGTSGVILQTTGGYIGSQIASTTNDNEN